MGKQDQKDMSIKILNCSVITVSNEQKVVKEVEIDFEENCFAQMGK